MSRVDAPGFKRALVVDDDAGVQGLFHTLLKKDGFSVDCVPTGREAFELLRRGSYSVILLDLMKPDGNGFELIDRLERDSPSMLRRVIVMTGASQGLVNELNPKRVWGMIRKPLDINEVLTSTKKCAAGRPPGNA